MISVNSSLWLPIFACIIAYTFNTFQGGSGWDLLWPLVSPLSSGILQFVKRWEWLQCAQGLISKSAILDAILNKNYFLDCKSATCEAEAKSAGQVPRRWVQCITMGFQNLQKRTLETFFQKPHPLLESNASYIIWPTSAWSRTLHEKVQICQFLCEEVWRHCPTRRK